MQHTLQFHAMHFLPSQLYIPLSNICNPASLAHVFKTTMPSSSEEYSFKSSEDYDETDTEEDGERQISVDPMSLKDMMKGPPVLIRPRYVSRSLPCSANSSPRWSSSLPNRRNNSITPAQSLRSGQGLGISRSKSCGDGRSSQPSDEFDILSRRPAIKTWQPPSVVPIMNLKKQDVVQPPRHKIKEEEFKCGALCLFLPAFSKKKVEAQLPKPKEPNVEDNGIDREDESQTVMSRVASFEKFECASWASSVMPDGNEEEFGGHINAYFDLPLELIHGAGDDANSPVKTAFVFDSERKGGLKKSTSRTCPLKSVDSMNRHVRFSTSAPMSHPASPASAGITPRLLKARYEFNALLEAQNTCINF